MEQWNQWYYRDLYIEGLEENMLRFGQEDGYLHHRVQNMISHRTGGQWFSDHDLILDYP